MPNIRFVCPACHTTLELDAQYAGQEVECGSCLQVFVATAPAAKPAKPVIRGYAAKPTRPSPPPRRPTRRDDDEPRIDYDDEPEFRPASGLGTAALVFGILSVVAFCCWPLSGLFGLLAVLLGALGRRNPMDRPSATAGIILGIVGLVLMAAVLGALGGAWNPPFAQ